MGDGLPGLVHDAVVRSHHEHDDIRHLGAAGAHLGEGGVAGGVDKGQVARRPLHVVGADVLGDAARLAGDHVGLADGVEDGGLAVVDMAHDRDHRRPGQGVAALLSLLLLQRLHFQFLGHGLLDLVAEIGRDQGRGFDVQGLVEGGEHAELHQRGDNLAGLDAHAFGQVADADRRDHLDALLDRLGLGHQRVAEILAGTVLLFLALARTHHVAVVPDKIEPITTFPGTLGALLAEGIVVARTGHAPLGLLFSLGVHPTGIVLGCRGIQTDRWATRRPRRPNRSPGHRFGPLFGHGDDHPPDHPGQRFGSDRLLDRGNLLTCDLRRLAGCSDRRLGTALLRGRPLFLLDHRLFGRRRLFAGLGNRLDLFRLRLFRRRRVQIAELFLDPGLHGLGLGLQRLGVDLLLLAGGLFLFSPGTTADDRRAFGRGRLGGSAAQADASVRVHGNPFPRQLPANVCGHILVHARTVTRDRVPHRDELIRQFLALQTEFLCQVVHPNLAHLTLPSPLSLAKPCTFSPLQDFSVFCQPPAADGRITAVDAPAGHGPQPVFHQSAIGDDKPHQFRLRLFAAATTAGPFRHMPPACHS